MPPPQEEVRNTGKVRVTKMSQNTGLLLKLLWPSRQRVGVEARVGNHLLDRDRHVKIRVPRTIDCTHPPLTQKGGNMELVLQILSNCKGHSSSY